MNKAFFMLEQRLTIIMASKRSNCANQLVRKGFVDILIWKKVQFYNFTILIRPEYESAHNTKNQHLL